MTSHVGRLYALAVALVVFFLTWAAVAARPWATHSAARADPRAAALAAREHRLRHESVAVARIVRRRWALYRVELRRRERRIQAVKRENAAAAHQAQLAASAAPSGAAAPSVRVVSLPPLTITRTS
ncbi:MAG TPA: hypothetical protein VE757_04760 [Gaiellaceae bacterium]|nr:hypothetical protein [Gaiellaceae bacterium]